jgi:hypothetical protein
MRLAAGRSLVPKLAAQPDADDPEMEFLRPQHERTLT